MVPPITAKARLVSVDALRGLVMIIMALDHTRDYFHAYSISFQPEDLARTTPLIFFTRWVTHICAPVFFFTAGLGASLWLQRGHSTGELARFLWTRGLWLMFLEVTVLRLAMNFSITTGPVLLTILWALGLSMVALALLVRLPERVLLSLSVAVIALHNLTDATPAGRFGDWAWAWNVVHQPGLFRAGGVDVIVGYTLLPWAAVMAAGFCLGRVMLTEDDVRQKWLLRLGLGLTAAFFVIRGINVYGNPFPWGAQDTTVKTVLSFFRLTKYPPSLSFLLMTLGPGLLLLACLDRARLARDSVLVTIGRVPLFYFLGHFFLIHALTIPFALWRHGHAGFLFGPLPGAGGQAYPPDYGYPLGVTYLVWIFVVLAMYPLCVWFARVKERRSDWWLRYL